MRRTMNIGRLNQRITLFRLEDAEDEMGQSTQKLGEVATIWADIYPVRGSEFYELKKIQSKVSHKCYIRYREQYADIDSNWYLKVDGKIFDIDSAIDVDFEHKMLEIRCYERINREGHEEVPGDPEEGEGDG
ncbi:MAG: phage head closure protein [Lachnospiraceae bacterium]|nr:phage head closure protein [Lachnospiraceae bacterium]